MIARDIREIECTRYGDTPSTPHPRLGPEAVARTATMTVKPEKRRIGGGNSL